MSFTISGFSSSVNNNKSASTKSSSSGIDWDSIWADHYKEKELQEKENNDLISSFYERMSIFNQRSTNPFQNLPYSGNEYATITHNDYKKFQVGANATTLDDVYNKNNGKKLAKYAEQTAKEMTNKRTSSGEYYCARGVRYTFEKVGLKNDNKPSGNAYQYAQILENNPNFKEIVVTKEDLKKLPAGCVIVYNNKETGTNPSDIYGHIAITLGNGKEASDRVCDITDRSNEYRVFVWS